MSKEEDLKETITKSLEGSLDVVYSDVVVGEVYPLYGVVTDFIDDGGDNIKLVINWNQLITINKPTEDKKNLIKERAFEPGIFITKITYKNEDYFHEKSKYYIEGVCSTVVFGKRQDISEV